MRNNPVSPKVTAGAVAAAVATVVVWALRVLAGVDVPDVVEGAFVVVLTFAAGYLKSDPERGYEARHGK